MLVTKLHHREKHMNTNPIDNSQLLAQMRKMAEAVGINQPTPSDQLTSNVNSGGFGNLLTKAINNVNATQKEAGMYANQVVNNDDGASLVKAMIASQKANISFQAVLQVRNKVADAYKEIMNMPL